jgi:hypothetical protein
MVRFAAALAARLRTGQSGGKENEQRGREAAVRGVFMRASSVQHGRVEATRQRPSDRCRP